MTLRAKVRNGGRRTARVKVVFYASANARRDKHDVTLGSARTAKLKHGKSGRAKLRASLPKAVKRGSWTLFACVPEGKRALCAKAAHKLVVQAPPTPPVQPASPPPAPPAPPTAQTVQIGTDVDWGYSEHADGTNVQNGDTITSTVRLGDAVAGQAGYDRADLPAQPSVTGTESTIIDGATDPDKGDDASQAVTLPFAFPFAGVTTNQIGVSTNGWISPAGPAIDYTNDEWRDDYRGGPQALGANVAAIAPLWVDLALAGDGAMATTAGRIVLVTAPGGDSVAIRWETYEYRGNGKQAFEAVLFKDGRIRFDYMDRSQISDGALPTATGISPGVGGRSADMTWSEAATAPDHSVLFTPRALAAASDVPEGAVSVTLPRDSSFVSADPSCHLAASPTTTTAGRVDCAVPSVAVGATATATVSWRAPRLDLFGSPEQTAAWDAGAQATSTRELAFGDFRDGSSVQLTPETGRSGANWSAVVALSTPEDTALRHPRLDGVLPAGLTIVGTLTDGHLNAEPGLQCPTLPAPGAGGPYGCELPNDLSANSRAGLVIGPAAPGTYGPISFTVTADNLRVPLQASTTLVVGP
ncbi:MAG TPA: hypothetical protein VGM91_12260 [Conexibacter sp.]